MGFTFFDGEKYQKNTILWLVKIVWNSNFSVCKLFYQTQSSHPVTTFMATITPKRQS